MIAFRKSTSSKQIIATNTRSKQKFLTPTQTTTTGQSTPCYNSRSLYWQQVLKKEHLKALKQERSFQFFTESLAVVTMSSA